MKPILVPVDFSGPAENAARYAVYLSKITKSNLYLCHAFLVPAEAPGSGQIAWPLYEGSTLEGINMQELEKLAVKLEIKDKAIADSSSFHPSISCLAVAGEPSRVISALAAEKRASLIVMGMSGAGAVTRFFMGSVTRSILEKAQGPVLLVSGNTHFKGINKIAFATELGEEDIQVIHSLTGFARYFDADIVVTHVTDEDVLHQEKSDAFLREVTNKVNYDKIYYRHVKNADIDEGLSWLTDMGQIDLLVMVHHQKGALSRLFSGSHTRKLASHINLPLLVFPSGKSFTF